MKWHARSSFAKGRRTSAPSITPGFSAAAALHNHGGASTPSIADLIAPERSSSAALPVPVAELHPAARHVVIGDCCGRHFRRGRWRPAPPRSRHRARLRRCARRPCASGTLTVNLSPAATRLTGSVIALSRVCAMAFSISALSLPMHRNGAVHDHLRRIDFAVAARARIGALPCGMQRRGQRVLPAEIIPVIDRTG